MSPRRSTAPLRDAILIDFVPLDGAVAAARALAATVGDWCDELRFYQAIESEQLTAYWPCALEDGSFSRLRSEVEEALRGQAKQVDICRLNAKLAIAGASAGVDAPYRYVVRTDVVDGGQDELERWYDVEHMPQLAAVPGAVLAQRMLCLDTAPRYFASYDLTEPNVLRSAPWLDVRATDWSGRVRPTFRRTRRTMSRRIDVAVK